MTISINWDGPRIDGCEIWQLQPSHLDDFYVTASDLDKGNLFFVLLASFHDALDRQEPEQAAHLSFLMAYYLFNALTPPGSQALAEHYIRQAIALHPLEDYETWRALIEQGN